MPGQYARCKDEEMREIFQSLIGCVPIWFTDQPGHCGQRKTTDENAAIIYDLFSSLEAESFMSKCLPPCTAVDYDIKYKSTTSRASSGSVRVSIIFHQNVQVARTSFVIDSFTVLNRLGGTIGICKAVLWCILCLVGVAQSGKQIIKAFLCARNATQDETQNC